MRNIDLTNPILSNCKDDYRRQIRSFALRQGKITKGQENAIVELMPKYGINYQESEFNFTNAFNRNVPLVIEIGFGMGHATWQIAKHNQENNYLAIEVHMPGIGSLLMQMAENSVDNIRIIRYDAVEVLKNMVADNSVTGVHIFFPDPWHKTRHHKRRIIQSEFISLLCNKLVKGGYIHLATDWHDYAIWMLDKLSLEDGLTNTSPTNDFVVKPDYRPMTKFENRGLNLGHNVWDLIFVKN